MKSVSHPFLTEYPFHEVINSYQAGAIRLYCHIRAHILRTRILRELGQYVPMKGKVSELGCGFGLFANCFALSRPDCTFTCCDLSEGRIAEANRVVERLGMENIEFHHADAVEFSAKLPPQDCVYMLDLVHHLPPDKVEEFIRNSWNLVRPGGCMLIKDVSDRPWPKMAFTWILDVLMTKGEFPNYLSPEDFLRLLVPLGGRIVVHYLDDYLPYPHLLYVVNKPAEDA